MNDRPMQEEAIFEQAVKYGSARERAAFLDEACGGSAELRARLELLLEGYFKADGFLGEEPPPRRPCADEAVGQTIGRYKLLEKVGEGGCGVVYVAEQTEPVRRRVALKVIKLGMDTKAVVARFEAERQALALMDHPNIAKVFDAGSTENGRPYFVMELVRGIKITDYCDQSELPTQARLKLFIQVCHAIQHAHQKGIIHRDIKPSNILVTLQDGLLVPKVIDFGIAKATQGRLTDATVYTQLHQIIGTLDYMSPEQAEMTSADVDTRSDIYSLGVLLYELLTGRTPFDAKELMSEGIDALRRKIRETEPLRPSTRVAALKPEELTTTAKRRSLEAPRLISLLKGDLDWVVMKCLEKDRTRRYGTANGVAADLQRYLDQQPVVARPASRSYRVHKWVRRNQLVFAAGSAVILALVVGLGAAMAMYLRERIARQELIAVEREHAIERAEVAATGGDFAALERALKEAQQRGVPDVRLLILRGFYSIETGQWRDALEPLQRAVQLSPQSVAARALLVSIYRPKDWQRYDEQLKVLQPLKPVTWEDYLFKGKAIAWQEPVLGLSLMDKAVELKPNSPLVRLVRGDARTAQAMSTGDAAMVQSALEDLKAASQFVPRDNFLLMTSFAWADAEGARIYGEAGRSEERKQLLEEAERWGRRLEQLPGGEGAAIRISQLEVCGRDTEAFEYMQRILPDHQHDPGVLYYYGNALYRHGRVQEAHDAYAKIRDTSSGAEYMRLIARMELSGGGDSFKTSIDKFYAQQSAWIVQASAPDTYRLAGLKDEARRRGRELCQHLPDHVSFFKAHYLNMGRFHAGLLDESALLDASRDSRRKLVGVYTSLGILHLSEGDRPGAKERFAQSVQTGMYVHSSYQLARVLLARLEQDPNWPPWFPLEGTAAAATQGNTSKN